MHSYTCHLSRKRKGVSLITIIFVLVMALLVAAVVIPFFAKASSNLGIFSDDKVEQDDDTLIGEMILITDKNYVNIDTSAIYPGLTKSFDLTSPAASSFACLPLPMAADKLAMCNGIDISLSTSPPKYTYIPEGVTIDISYDNDPVYSGVEGYAIITVPSLYEINKTLLQGGNELALCKNPLEQTCYVYNAAPPVYQVILKVKVGQDISVRIPFYYDNLANPNTGVADEKTCTDKPKYSNIEAQATKLNVKVEGPSYPYDITVIHMEKPHEREYAQYCSDSIPDDTPVPFDVQVVSGDYDFFRIYGWSSSSCVKSLEDIPVKKGTTRDVTLRFDC